MDEVIDVDELEERAAQFIEALDNPEAGDTWADLVPIKGELLPVETFHPDLLPDVLRDWVVDSADRMDRMPLDFFAVGIIVCLASMIGKRISIHPKQHDSWAVIPNLWGGGIGRPSTKKTPAFREAMRFSRHLEAEAHKAYQAAQTDYQAGEDAHKIHKKVVETEVKKVVKLDHYRAKKMLLEVADSVEKPPVRQRYVVTDTTIEKLGELLQDNPNGLLMFRDELTGWLHALDKDGREQDRAFYLEAWNGGGDFSWDRIGRGSIYIPSVVVGVLGGIQPGKLLPYLRSMKEGVGDDGLLQRFQMLVWPDVEHPTHIDKAPDKLARRKVETLFEFINELPADQVVRFDADGQIVFDRWYTEMLAKEATEPNHHMESHLVKYHSLLPSLALVFQVVDARGAVAVVGEDAAVRAVAWCRYLETHARRIYGLMDDPLDGARILSGRLNRLSNPFKLKEIADKGWSGLKSTEKIKHALTELESRNYLAEVSEPTDGRPSIVYHINPDAIALAEDGAQ